MTYRIDQAASELMIEPEELIAILDCFFEETTEMLSYCDNAVISGNFSALNKMFHALKGSSANFRLHRLRDLAIQLENGAGSADRELVATLLQSFRRELADSRELVDLYRSGKKI